MKVRRALIGLGTISSTSSPARAAEEMSGSATHQIHSLRESILLLREPAEDERGLD